MSINWLDQPNFIYLSILVYVNYPKRTRFIVDLKHEVYKVLLPVRELPCFNIFQAVFPHLKPLILWYFSVLNNTLIVNNYETKFSKHWLNRVSDLSCGIYGIDYNAMEEKRQKGICGISSKEEYRKCVRQREILNRALGEKENGNKLWIVIS